MNDQTAIGIAVVRVTPPPSEVERRGALFWAAAMPRDEAVAAVAAKFPPQWLVELTDERLTIERVQRLNMKMGAVRELTDADE